MIPTLEIRLRDAAKEIVSMVVISKEQAENWIKDEMDKYLSSGEFEKQIREGIKEAIHADIKSSLQSWEVKKAITEKMIKVLTT